ncbi:aminotransferase class I/II-fold pyridoxal phosphate-dependent enzyme [Tessaracoccus terricola]
MAIFSVELERLRRRKSIKWARWEPDVLPMFVAEMDVDPAPAVTERLQQLIADGDFGYPELPVYQEAFADFADWMWGWRLGPSEDVALAGDVMSGMRELTLAVTEPGDAVVINPPIYPPFRAVVRETGRRLVEVPMTAAGRLDLDVLAEVFAAERPTAYLLCSPHNPNGTVHTRAELEAVAALAAHHGVTVISDEIHAPLAGPEHIPFTTIPGAGRAFVVTSASKSWNLAGLKAALLVAGSQAHDVLRGLPGHVAESASHVAIEAHSAALDGGRDWLQQASREIAQNKLHLRAELERHLPQVSYEPSEGTYLAWLDCSALGLEHAGRHFHTVGRVRFNFGTDFDAASGQFVRMNVATSPELISEGVRRMAASL